MRINDFLQTISRAGGLARPTRFQVQIYPTTLIQHAIDPSWLTEYAAVDTLELGTRLSLMCTRASLPGYQFQTDITRSYGPAYKFPVVPEYQDQTFSFYVGQDMAEKYFFDAWMYSIMDPVTNNFNYISEYACQMDILQFDENDMDEPTYQTTLLDAYPVSMGDLQLSWEHMNQVHKLDVTFTFKAAIPFQGKQSTSGMGVNSKAGLVQFNDTIGGPHPFAQSD